MERRGRCFGGGVCRGEEVICYCPKCGYEMKKPVGTPCKELTCPKCGTQLIRKK